MLTHLSECTLNNHNCQGVKLRIYYEDLIIKYQTVSYIIFEVQIKYPFMRTRVSKGYNSEQFVDLIILVFRASTLNCSSFSVIILREELLRKISFVEITRRDGVMRSLFAVGVQLFKPGIGSFKTAITHWTASPCPSGN